MKSLKLKFLAIMIVSVAFLTAASTATSATGTTYPPSMTYGGDSFSSSVFLPGDELSSGGYIATVDMDATDNISKSCGNKVRGVRVRLKSYTPFVQVTLWTYRMVLDWSWCNYKVTNVNALYDESPDTCCQWSFVGNVAKYHSLVGQASMIAYTRGHFHACAFIFVVCKDRYPTAQLTVNGNGVVTDLQWSAG